MESFLVQIGIIFLSAAAMAFLLKLVKLPPVIAYILAGFGLLFLDPIIHFDTHMIELISELGIILLLFLAGMEVNLKTFKSHAKYSAFIGLIQIALFTGIGAWIGYGLLEITDIKPLIFFGLCLAFSSTIVVIGLLEERKELKAFHGQISLGILIIQDITAVVALLFLDGEPSLGSILKLAITVTAFVLGAWVFARYFWRKSLRPLPKVKSYCLLVL